MSDKTAQLDIVVDPSGVEANVSKVKRTLAGIGATAEKVGEQASKGLDKVGQGGAQVSQKIDAATRSLIGQLQRTSAALQAGGRNTREYYETLANQRGANLEVLKPYLAQLDAVTAAQKRVSMSAVDLDKVGTSRGATGFTKSLDGVGTSLGASGFGEAQKSIQQVQQQVVKATAAVGGLDQRLNATGMTAKQTAAALRQVPAQFTDIVVSLQAGQNPLTVLLQQGGQLKDTFGGVGAAAGALGRYVLGLVTPFTAVAAAVAAVGAGIYAGDRELAGLNRTLILTGNQAGVTAGYVSSLARNIGAIAGTQGGASQILLDLASSGKVAASSLERFATAAIQMERVGGPAAEATNKAFAELGKAPLQAALKLNEATGFLTRSVYEQIQALEDQGRTVEAARVAQDAYASELESRVPRLTQELGYLERAWRGVTDATSEAWDFLKGLGRDQSPAQRLAALQNDMMKIGAPGMPEYDRLNAQQKAFVDRFRQAKEQELGALNRQLLLESEVSAQQRYQLQQVEARRLADEALAKLGFKRLSQAEQEVSLRRTLLDGGYDEETAAKAVAALRERNNKKTPRGKTDELRGLEVDLGAIERDLRSLTGAYADAESILAAQRQAGLLDERDYYEARRAFIRLNTEAQVRALQAENTAIQSSIDSGKLRAEERTRQGEKIKDNLSQIQSLEARAAAQTLILGVQQTSAINAVSRAYQEARQSAQDYIDSLAQAQRRDIESIGMSDGARSRQQGRQRIEDDYARDRRRIENERNLLGLQQGGSLTSDQQKRFDDLLALNREFETKALESYREYTDARLGEEARWENGATRAVNQYLEEAQNIAAQVEGAFSNAFRGMEDSLVEFIKTGRLDFKSLADSIVADLARIIVKQQLSKALGLVGGSDGIVGAASSFLGSLLGGGTPPGRAIGGPVSAGQLYRVNERKPELLQVAGQQYLMMGNQSGQVKPEASTGPARVQNFNLTVQVPAGANRATAQQTGREIAQSLQIAMARGA